MRSTSSAANAGWSRDCARRPMWPWPTNGRPTSPWRPTSSNTVIARAAYRDEIEATGQLIELQKQQVDIAHVQADAGTVPYSNVLSLESQLASYEATIPQLEQKLSQSDDLLAALAAIRRRNGRRRRCAWTI